jgi:uncharacterized membrane protein
MTYLLYSHLIIALLTFLFGFYVFARKLTFSFENPFVIIYINLHLATAATGLFIGDLDVTKFSPFQWLSVITIIAYIQSFRRIYTKKFERARIPMFGAYLGLCIAFAGALHPNRITGYRLWRSFLGLNSQDANQYWSILMIGVSVPLGFALVYYNIKELKGMRR